MLQKVKYVKAPPGWQHTGRNPFTDDGEYGCAWSAFCILEKEDDQLITGKSGEGPFSARFGRRVPNLENRLADYLLYENAHGRTVILSFPPEIDCDQFVSQALAHLPAADVIRPEDPPVLVHATTQAAWESIQVDGELKAASQLGSRQTSSPVRNKSNPVEAYLTNEPPEYRDYIMFGEMTSCGPEMVVASYQAGEFVFDENAIFTPGMRLYIDNHRLIRDGLGTRDGLHVMKVRKRLPLQPYLLASVGVLDICPPGKSHQVWTLRKFVEAANELFLHR